MKKFIWLMLACILVLPGYAQESATRGTANNVIQPTIVVVPFAKRGQDVRQLIEDNLMVSKAITVVQGKFQERGFITNDFIQLAKTHARNDMISEGSGAAGDLITDIINESDAEISVEIRITVNKEPGGVAEAHLELTAKEAISGASLASESYSSDKFRTSDSIKLVDRALSNIDDDFFIKLQNGFNDIITNGRNMNIRIEFAEGGQVTAYTRIGTPPVPLERQIRNWAKNNSFGGNYKPRVTKNLIDLAIKVPLYDQKTGESYQITDIQDPLMDLLYEIVPSDQGEVEVTQSSGQQISIMIR